METKIALLVVYNHRFDKNIKRVDNLYNDKFSYIYHIVPFYDNIIDNVNVIPVYESSWYFQGYIAQAYTHLRDKKFTHFLVIADDLLLNPLINEVNLWDKIGIDFDDCFMPSTPILIQTTKRYWGHSWEAIKYSVDVKGVEVKNILPSVEEAKRKFLQYGFPVGPIPYNYFIKHYQNWILSIKNIPWKRQLNYPLIGCYSDTFLVTAGAMDKFCTYCGAFAATCLHVELAIPTALILASEKVKFQHDLKLNNGALWPSTIGILDKYNYNLKELIRDFPQDKFFLHPIKLSKWE